MSAVLERLSTEVGTSERTLRRAVAEQTIRAERPSPNRLLVSPEEAEYVRTHWKRLAELRALLRTEPNVAFACVFGSVARGTDREDSDLDLLVALRREHPLALARMKDRIERRCGRRVQVVGMQDATRNPSLLLTILRDGRVLVDRDGVWAQLQERMPRIRRAAAREDRQLRERAEEAADYFADLARTTHPGS